MNETQTSSEIADISEAVENKIAEDTPLTLQQQTWIDYNAVGGLISEVDGNFRMSPSNPKKKFSVQDLADELAVTRDTLYYWSRSIPKFKERVAARRKEINSETRVTQVWNGLYLKGRGGNARAAAIYLANHDPNFVMPTQKVEHDATGGIADLLELARKRSLQSRNVQEGEVVESNPTNT